MTHAECCIIEILGLYRRCPYERRASPVTGIACPGGKRDLTDLFFLVISFRLYADKRASSVGGISLQSRFSHVNTHRPGWLAYQDFFIMLPYRNTAFFVATASCKYVVIDPPGGPSLVIYGDRLFLLQLTRLSSQFSTKISTIKDFQISYIYNENRTTFATFSLVTSPTLVPSE